MIAPNKLSVDQQISLAGRTAKIANVRDGRDAGGEYKIVVVEFDEETYADFRFYGDLSKDFFEEAASPAEVPT